jgi:hypothetical protein
MLELRPSCEHCDKDLSPDSTVARICSFECSFCADCVEQVLHNVCPNCGGGFTDRPIRPAQNWKDGNNLGHYPASQRRVFKPVNLEQHAQFITTINGCAAQDR